MQVRPSLSADMNRRLPPEWATRSMACSPHADRFHWMAAGRSLKALTAGKVTKEGGRAVLEPVMLRRPDVRVQNTVCSLLYPGA